MHEYSVGSAPLDRLLELSYVTNSLDQSLALMRTTFGIERWMETGIATVDLGAAKAARLKIAVAYLGPMLIELQEPVGCDVTWYRELLSDTGFAMRLHHLGFSAPDSGTLATLKHSESTHAIP